jgi:hypothetical protein
MRFVFKVLVLVMLIVASKFVKDEDSTLATNQSVSPTTVKMPDVSGKSEINRTFPQASEAKVEKASLQF